MKLALFHATLPEPGRKVGGVEMTVHLLANALVQHQHQDVTLFSFGPKPPDALYKHRLLFQGRFKGKIPRLFLAPIAMNFVNFRDYDVLHLHGDDWFFFKRDIATVRSMHGSALHEARTALSLQRKIIQRILYPLEHLSVRLATKALAAGTETAKLFGITELGDYGVDLSRFQPREKSPTPLLFFLGMWNGRKRGAFAYKVFTEQVLPVYPDAQLYMATDWAPTHPNVINGGFPTSAELADWMARAWVFLCPSNYEGFGIPYIEGLASGTAMVATPNGGADYVLDAGRYGCVAEDADFGAAVVHLLANPQERERLQELGLEYVKRFSWENVSARYMDFYRAAFAQRHRS